MYISTTAGGEGLIFDKRLGNIFDEIECIKNDENFIDYKQQREIEELGF